MASFLSSGHPVPVVLPQRLASWALQCYYVLGRQCQFIMSLLSHFLHPIRLPCMWASPSTLPWLLGRLAMPCQGVLLAMWVLWSLLRSSACGILLSLVLLLSTTLSRLFHVPCPSGSGVSLPYRLPCLHHREFVWSRLLASVHGLSAADDLFPCGSCGFSLSGGGRYRLLQAPRSSFSLRSPQYMVAVVSRSSSTSSSFLGRLGSPPRSPCRSPLRFAVHHPLLPFALPSGCGFTLPFPLRPCCLLTHCMAGFEVSLAWLFFLLSVLGFSYSWSILMVQFRVPKIVDLLLFTALHRQLSPPVLDHIGLFLKG